MPRLYPSGMRANIVITILVMGILSISYSTLTANYFQKYTLDNHREQLTHLAELEVHNLRDQVVTESINLGMSVQSIPELRKAIKLRSKKKIVSSLDQHFHRAFVTLGILELEKLIVFDKHVDYLYASSEGIEHTNIDDICSGIIQQLKQRKGTDAIKPFSRMCLYDDRLHLISIVPVGGLRIKGYLAVVVNPMINLIQAEKGVGVPLKVESIMSRTLYKSNKWPHQNNMDNFLVAEYGFKSGNPVPIGYFKFAFDIIGLKKQLNQTRTVIIGIVTGLTVIVVLISLLVFQRSILNPLYKLASYLRLVKKDKSYLGKDIKVSGSKEIVELADDFNEMSRELKSLYYKLENMAFTDSLTGIPNRALLLDRLHHVTLVSKRESMTNDFTFMLIDLDRFKQVNDTYGHNIGDHLLQLVAERLKSTIRESDTVARLGGDEFAIILNGISENEIAEELAKKITDVMSEPIIIDGNTLDIGISIGIAFYPEDGVTTKRIMRCADEAMYYAKNNNLPYSFYKLKN